jgi:lipopolysaccharide export system permease protein
MIKTYKKYIIILFLKILLRVYGIMASLIIIINLFEEISFLRNSEVTFFYPILLSALNMPPVIYEISPFVFLIATQFFFIELIEKNELQLFKLAGLTNLDLLKILSFLCFILGILMITIFYDFSAKSKNYYLELKNKLTNDNKYLAVVTENGLWIKDEIDNNTNIINAERIINNLLINVTISQFNENFDLIQNIDAKRIDISNKEWLIYEGKSATKNEITPINEFIFESNFNSKRINSYFSNLSSLNFPQLLYLKKEYEELNYSTIDIRVHLHKIFSFPIYLTVMSIFSAIIMFSIKYQRNTILNIIGGVFISVLIYYLNFLINAMGTSGLIPLIISVWLPLIILVFFSLIWLVTLNEK